MATSQPPLGLIAGGGQLPLATVAGIHAAGREVACVGLRDCYDAELVEQCDLFKSAGIIQINRWARLLRRWKVDEVVMVGRVNKIRMYEPFRVIRQIPDLAAARVWFLRTRHDKRPDAVLGAVADELQSKGITMIDSTRYIPELLAEVGVLGKHKPSAKQLADIEFALPIVQRMGDLDVGQSVAVRDCEMLAVEAIEGTDRMIARAGELCRSGKWTLLKIAKPQQDMRFDVPTVGPKTIENLKAANAGCLAVQAGKTIILDKDQVLATADQAGIAVIGIEVGE